MEEFRLLHNRVVIYLVASAEHDVKGLRLMSVHNIAPKRIRARKAVRAVIISKAL